VTHIHAAENMSGSVTPARRRRDEGFDEEEEEEDVSVDGESTKKGNTNKRMRMSNGRDHEADSGTEVRTQCGYLGVSSTC
jgi:hypothetical protein